VSVDNIGGRYIQRKAVSQNFERKEKILFKNVKTRSCEQDTQLKFLTSVTNVFYFLSMQKKRKITDKKKKKKPLRITARQIQKMI